MSSQTYIIAAVIVVVVGSYFRMSDKSVIKDIATIISGLTVAIAVTKYMQEEAAKIEESKKQKRLNFAQHISDKLASIDGYYLKYPNDLDELYYEFYGYSNFPWSEKQVSKNINKMEFIVINIIIENLESIYHFDPVIFDDNNVKNKIVNYTKSNKFRQVWMYVKHNHTNDFVKKMEKSKLIVPPELYQVSIPYINL